MTPVAIQCSDKPMIKGPKSRKLDDPSTAHCLVWVTNMEAVLYATPIFIHVLQFFSLARECPDWGKDFTKALLTIGVRSLQTQRANVVLMVVAMVVGMLSYCFSWAGTLFSEIPCSHRFPSKYDAEWIRKVGFWLQKTDKVSNHQHFP